MPNKNHRLPVGKAQPIMMHIQSATGETYTTALFKASDVPVGTELYATPSDRRLSLELEVANENAAHHKALAAKRGNDMHNCRKILRAVNLLLQSKSIDYLNQEVEADAKKLMDMIDKELG